MGPDLRMLENEPQTSPYCHRLEVAVPGKKVLELMKKVFFYMQLSGFQVTEVIHGPSAAAHKQPADEKLY